MRKSWRPRPEGGLSIGQLSFMIRYNHIRGRWAVVIRPVKKYWDLYFCLVNKSFCSNKCLTEHLKWCPMLCKYRKHVTLNIACACSQRYTNDSVFWLAQIICIMMLCKSAFCWTKCYIKSCDRWVVSTSVATYREIMQFLKTIPKCT